MNLRYERWRWQTFGITWLIYASFYLTRQSFSVAKVAISSDPHVALDRNAFGLIDATFLTVYMLGQFVCGPLGDRFGPRRILLLGLALSVAAAVGSGFSTTLAAFLAFAVLQGVAQSTGWSNTTKTMSSWFSVGERGRVIGGWCTCYTVGPAVALPFAAWMMNHYGEVRSGGQTGPAFVPFWPAAFWGTAGVVAGVALLAWLLLRSRPEDVGLPPIEEYHREPESLIDEFEPIEAAPDSSWTLVVEVLSTPSIWMLAFAYFSVKLVRYTFIFWGPKYVAESLHSDAFASSITAAAMPIGGLVGVIGVGFVSDKLFQARRAPAAIFSLLALALVISAGSIPIHNIWWMAAFFFLVGVFLFGPDSIISATASMDFGTKRGAGTAVGFVNGIGSLGGILGGWLPAKITTDVDWTPLFSIMLVGLIVSAVVLMPLWRTKPPTA